MSQAISGVIVGGGNIYSSPTTQLDDELSSTSINAVQNKVISDALDEKAGLEDNNNFSGNNVFTGSNTFGNGLVNIDNNGLTIRATQGTLLTTNLGKHQMLYHGSELATKDDLKNAGSSSSIDEQSLMILLCGGSTIRTGTDKSDWVIEGTTAHYVYTDDKDITSSDKVAACDVDNYKILKTVCGAGTITIYYPNTNIPDDGVGLLIKY